MGDNTKRPKNPNGTGSIYQVQTISGPRWQSSRTVGLDANKKPIRITGSGKTATEARNRMAVNIQKYYQRQAGINQPPNSAALRPNEQKLTVASWLYIWLEDLPTDRVSDAVKRRYAHIVELHLAPPPFGDIRLANLTSKDIRDLMNKTLPAKRKLRGEGKGVEPLLGASSLKNIHTVLAMALKHAINEGKIERNPINAVPRPRVKRDHEDANRATWKPQTLLAALDGRDDEAIWLVALTTMMRQSERLGLTWDCLVNLTSKDHTPYIEIKQQLARKQVNHGCGKRDPSTLAYPCGQAWASKCPQKTGESGYYIKHETKSEAGNRRIPMAGDLPRVLNKYKRLQDKWKKSPDWKPTEGMENLVFTTKTGKPIRHQEDTEAWHKLLADYNIPYQRGHLNRHIGISVMVAQGVNIETVRAIAGHSSEEITRAIYTHLGITEMSEAMELMMDKMERKKRAIKANVKKKQGTP